MSGGYVSINGIKKQESVKKVADRYDSESAMSAFCVVRVKDNFIVKSIMNGTYDDAKAIGITTNAGTNLEVLIFGTVEDKYFSKFNTNDFLYVGIDSMPTNVVPENGYFIRIGKYLGNNIALIQVEPPVLL